MSASDGLWDIAHNIGSAWTFPGLFFSIGTIHIWQSWRYKSWQMTATIPIAAFFLGIGIACRAAAAQNGNNINMRIVGYVFTLSGSPIFSAACHIITARTLYYIPWLSPIRPNRYAAVATISFIITEIILAHGAARISESADGRNALPVEVVHKIGVGLVLTSLFIQLATVKVSVILLAVWHKRVKCHSLLTTNLRFVLAGLYITAALTTARCVYRIVQFFEGTEGLLNSHEAYFYVFEAGCMLAVAYALNICHPGPRFPQDIRVFLAEDRTSEVTGPGLATRRKRSNSSCSGSKSRIFCNEPITLNADTTRPERRGEVSY